MTASALFNTAVMGMSAQTNALGNISENIANSNTVGYKNATTQFSTLLTSFQGGETNGGGVQTSTRIAITSQGPAQTTSSSTDLAIQGSGFFVVSNSAGDLFLTRAGSFVPDEQGRLVNSAGYYLMGYDNSNGNASVGDAGGMEIVTVSSGKLSVKASTAGSITANLNSDAAIVAAADLPSVNAANSTFTSKTSLTTYDYLGHEVKLDIYFAKTAADTWEMSVYDSSGATSGAFPYSSPALVTQTLTFDPTTGNMLSGSPLSLTVPNGNTLTLDVGDTTQLAAEFSAKGSVNGNAASAISDVAVASDGTLSYSLGSGQTIPAYLIALANVPGPYGLTPVSGNVFATSIESGSIFVGTAGTGSFGKIASSQLEGSTVDLAAQLSDMIVAQRSYTANSQVFQVASDILQVLNNLK